MITIVITGQPAWLDHVAAAIPVDRYRVAHYTGQIGYVARLADDVVGLILVDGEGDDWRFWTVTPKTSPATRRIPVILMSDDSARRDEALTSGADRAISLQTLQGDLPALLKLARVTSSESAEQLRDQCAEPLTAEGLAAIAQFNAGDYYHQHDTFEALWMAETRPIRDLYRAILQVGIAYYQITLGNWRGAHKMLLRSIQWLAPLPDVCQGVDIAQLRADAAAVRAELERVGEAGIASFDKTLLTGVKLSGKEGF